MATWKIIGASKQTGADVEFAVQAQTRAEADQIAHDLGVSVTRIFELPPPPTPIPPPPTLEHDRPDAPPHIAPMGRYRVIGANLDSGVDTEITVDAATPAEAELIARGCGLAVSRVVEILDGSVTTPLSSVRITMAIVSVAGALGTFMPWIHVPIMGALDGTRGDGWISFFAFASATAVCLLPSPRVQLQKGGRTAVCILGFGSCALGLNVVLRLSEIMKPGDDDGPISSAFTKSVSIGMGVWLIVVSGALLAIMSFALTDAKQR